MKLSKLFPILFFLLAALSVAGQDTDGYSAMKNVVEFQHSIQTTIGSIKTIRANFQQEKHLSIFSKTIDSEGTMAFKSPDKLKWAYTNPYNYVIQIKDQTITINDDGKANTFDLSASEKFSDINRLILNSITGKILDDDRFTTQYFENANTWLVVLIPKDAEIRKYMNVIQIYIAKKDKQVSGIKLIESETDFTLINFSNQVLNKPIADDVFDTP